MARIGKINFPNTGDARKDFEIYKFDLERRLNFVLTHIPASDLVTGLSPDRIVRTNASGNIESVDPLTDWIIGTAGNITVTDNFDGTVTLKSIGSTTNVKQVTTTPVTLLVSEQGFIECNSASAIILNLPTAVGNTGLSYSITSINSGIITIEPFASETLQSDTNFDLYEDENLQIISNGTNWTVG